MSSFLKAFLMATAIALSGCAATVKKPVESQQALKIESRPTAVALQITGSSAMQSSPDWQTFRAEWRTAFAGAASGAGLPFSYQETESFDATPGTVFVKITVNDYRYVTSGARYGLGVMTGNAFIDASAQFIALPSRLEVGAKKYSTSSSAWEGIFSAMTDKQVMAISNEIVGEITRK
jgi:hypothetical protein